MTKPTTFPKFPLKKGLEYTWCNPSQKCTGTETFRFTKDNYVVDLVVQRDPDGKPKSATAYMPNEAVCLNRNLPGSPECQLDLHFEGEQLAKLISSSPIIQGPLSDSEHSSKSKLEILSLDGEGVPSNIAGHAPYPAPASGISGLNPYYALGLIAIRVPITTTVMARRLRKRDLLLRSVVKNVSHNRNTIAAMRASPSAPQAQLPRAAVKSFDANNKMASRGSQIDIDQQIEEILLCLDSLEQQMTAILVRTSFKEDKIDESG